MTCYGNDVSAISEGTFAIWGYGQKSGITDVVKDSLISDLQGSIY